MKRSRVVGGELERGRGGEAAEGAEGKRGNEVVGARDSHLPRECLRPMIKHMYAICS